MTAIDTVIFDLDGTLYDEERIYDRYAEEIARRLPSMERDSFIRRWGVLKSGAHQSVVGLGFDESLRTLFRHTDGRVTGYVDWEGKDLTMEYEPVTADLDPLFGTGRMQLGDWWGVLAALASTYGLALPERQAAFLATRDYMRDDGRLSPAVPLRHLLATLQGSGVRPVAMSNSPVNSVFDTLDQLGVLDCFSDVRGDAEKPAGMLRFLQTIPQPERSLSVGDNYVNDIEPALAMQCRALYIDRHNTRLGAGHPGCTIVSSIGMAWTRLPALVADPATDTSLK